MRTNKSTNVRLLIGRAVADLVHRAEAPAADRAHADPVADLFARPQRPVAPVLRAVGLAESTGLLAGHLRILARKPNAPQRSR